MVKLKHILYLIFGKSYSKLAKIEKTIKFYGRVNSWASSDKSDLRKDLDACVKYGVRGYHIELVGWSGRTTIYRSKKWKDAVSKRYKWLVEECRARNMWLFVSMVNDNAGKSGSSWNPRLEKQQDTCMFAIETIQKNGPKNVIVQVVSEIQTSYGQKLEATYGPIFKQQGFKVVYNAGGRTDNRVPGYADWNASHMPDITRMCDKSQWNVSDHSLIIRQLCYGLEGKGNPETTTKWVQLVRNNGNPVVCFYHYAWNKHDKNIIKAFGKA